QNFFATEELDDNCLWSLTLSEARNVYFLLELIVCLFLCVSPYLTVNGALKLVNVSFNLVL
ncbi:MAG: hypothetical protein Q4F70_06265, partial [Clostridia bacterium]|nr:hypothetical protein [Clostridia bacterium]